MLAISVRKAKLILNKEILRDQYDQENLMLRILTKILLKVFSLLVMHNTQVMASHQTSITQTDSPCVPYK